MANPRIDDLRKKLEREPGSRLFAQLAEELRKEGQLDEAIRVARHGLDKHPNYPSARMTLGRALLDSGELSGARREFEAVLKGAPDNILASRYLAECLEGLGQRVEALARYRATLAMAPGDKQVIGRIEALSLSTAAKPAAAIPGLRGPEPARPPQALRPLAPGQATDPMAAPEEIFEVEPDPEPDDAPIPLVAVDESEFELERPLEGRAALDAISMVTPEPDVAPQPVAPEPAPVPAERSTAAYEREVMFDPDEAFAPPAPPPAPAEHTLEVRRPDLGAPPAPEPEVELEPEPEPEPQLPPAEVLDEEFDTAPASGGPIQMTFRAIVDDSLSPIPAPSPAPTPTPAPAASAEPELASPTLAELYFDQGFLDKAIEVYRRLLERDPGQERLQARLREIEAVQRLHAAASTSAPAPAASGRRAAVERTIARLQDLRTALARRT